MDSLVALLFLSGVALFVLLPLAAFTSRRFDRFPTSTRRRYVEPRHEVVRVEVRVRETAEVLFDG